MEKKTQVNIGLISAIILSIIIWVAIIFSSKIFGQTYTNYSFLKYYPNDIHMINKIYENDLGVVTYGFYSIKKYSIKLWCKDIFLMTKVNIRI